MAKDGDMGQVKAWIERDGLERDDYDDPGWPDEEGADEKEREECCNEQ